MDNFSNALSASLCALILGGNVHYGINPTLYAYLCEADYASGLSRDLSKIAGDFSVAQKAVMGEREICEK